MVFSGLYPKTTFWKRTSPFRGTSDVLPSGCGTFQANFPVYSPHSRRPSALSSTLHRVMLPSSVSGSSSIMSKMRSAPERAASRKFTWLVNWFIGMALWRT